MAWSIKEHPHGIWEWEIFLSSYGCASGYASSFLEAFALVAIAEADLVDEPYEDAEEIRARPCLVLGKPDLPDIERAIGKHIHPMDPAGFRRYIVLPLRLMSH